ncbi:dTDP-glucose 4,6-dehydratase [bacterium]|jgi:dTDP-glucose 4,6-dehydratase|nr:dTDP-glucose 4,6-dehydratase [bacterium]
MKKYLVTGGAGFIGANFILTLLEKYGDGIEIHNVDCLTYAGNLENLKSVKSPRYHFHKCDIRKRDELESVFRSRQFDCVIHFAAESHVDRSILDSTAFIETNVLGTQNLLDLSRNYEVDRFVHVSTDEVYGTLSMDAPPFTEAHQIEPNSPYSASKAGSDLLVRSYVETYGFPGIITRCSNNYGPFQFPEKLIPLMVCNAQENKALPVYGKGDNVRDWIHVTDHCKAVETIARKGRVGEAYNIGGDAEMPNIDVVKSILKILDKPETLIEYVTDRLGHDFRYAMNHDKLTRETGWQPQMTFEKGLENTVKWYVDHPEWTDSVRSGAYMDYYQDQYGEKK